VSPSISKIPRLRALGSIPGLRVTWNYGNSSVGRVAGRRFLRTGNRWDDEELEYHEETEKTDIPENNTSEQNSLDERRIYILGAGNVGSFIAHSLAGLRKPPPITLLFQQPTAFSRWNMVGRSIQVTSQNYGSITRNGFGFEVINGEDSISEEDKPIKNLVVAVKAGGTVAALSNYQHRLGPDSTILFLQNGMGMLKEVSDAFFPTVEARPTYAVGIISHGLYNDRPFMIKHAGAGTITLGVQGSGTEEGRVDEEDASKTLLPPSARYLLRTLTRCPVLAAFGLNSTEVLQIQLEKLAANCVINALTVMFDCKNGDILHNPAISRCMHLLLAEISLVIRSLPEMQHLHNVELRFSPRALERRVIHIAQTTKNNFSSMLQDVRKGNMTEIDYMNGYIIKRGEEMGIKCIVNYTLMQMVKGKQTMMNINRQNQLPLLR
jgi:2-dehydropantoate 2-reductase